MDGNPKTALERIQEEAAKLGVKVEVVKPVRESGTITSLTKKRDSEERGSR